MHEALELVAGGVIGAALVCIALFIWVRIGERRLRDRRDYWARSRDAIRDS